MLCSPAERARAGLPWGTRSGIPPCPTPRQEKVTAMIQGDDLPQARIHLPCLDTIISDLNCKLGYLDEDIALINLIWQGSRQVRPVRR